MNKKILLLIGILILVLVIGVLVLNSNQKPTTETQTDNQQPPAGTQETNTETGTQSETPPETPTIEEKTDYPKIASWLAKKDQLIASGKPYDLVMAGWFTPEEAAQLRTNNPDVKLLAGLTTTWVWDNEGWKSSLLTVASYGKDTPFELTEDMYLHDASGARCGFGWASEEWNQEEIYAMDPRNPEWVDLITSFYKMALDQPQHDGIIVDMVVEKQYWCDTISDEEWLAATNAIYDKITEFNTENKMVIFNAGARFSDIDAYSGYFDGYLMENFMGDQLKTTFQEGLDAANSPYTGIYAVDTDDTGQVDLNKMRLGLTLSLLNDNTYFTYDFGPRDHGQAWWYPEYDVDLGKPLGACYLKDGAYWREYEKGIVVAAPNGVTVNFDVAYTDVTSGVSSTSFTIEPGDGRIFLSTSITN